MQELWKGVRERTRPSRKLAAMVMGRPGVELVVLEEDEDLKMRPET